jgi:hypothetical protein
MSGRARGHGGRRLASAAILLAVFVGGCNLLPFGQSEAGYKAVAFQNQTTETVDVVYLPPTGVEAVIVHAIGPGQVGSDDAVAGGKCTIGVLIARNETGQEVARRTEPLCLGETWLIVADGGGSPAVSP